MVSGLTSGNTYSAYPDESFFPDDPNPSNLQFKTGVISTADQTFMAVATGPQSGWRSELTLFSSSQSLFNALDQPWTITLDQGLPTERHLTMNLNLGSLPSIDLTPPVITLPLPKSVIDPLTPTFTFTPPALNVPISIGLEHLPPFATEGTFISDDQLTLPAGSMQWSPPAPLFGDTQYIFNLEVFQNSVAGVAFSDPIDANGNALPGWSSGGNITLQSMSFFSTPEPGPGGLIGICAILLIVRPRQRC